MLWSWIVGMSWLVQTAPPHPRIGRLHTGWWGPMAEVAKLKKTKHMKRGSRLHKDNN